LCPNVPFWIEKQLRKTLERFVGSAQSAQRFRRAEQSIHSKTGIAIGYDLAIERQRLGFVMRRREQLRAPKIRRRTLTQSRIRQQVKGVSGLIRCDHRLEQSFRGRVPIRFR
jgi:hypothetical protein